MIVTFVGVDIDIYIYIYMYTQQTTNNSSFERDYVLECIIRMVVFLNYTSH